MSQTIGSIYSDLLKEKFIKTKLRAGEIPAVEDINKSINDLRVKYNNFNSPLIKKDIYYIESEEVSSAKKMNNSFDFVKSDLSVCIKSLLDQGNKITDLYDSTFTKLEGFERKLEKLQSKITSLLFESKNSEKHEQVFYEKFESKDMINKDLTTADIDELANSVSLKASVNDVIPFGIGSDSIQVNTVNHPSIINSLDINGLEVVNLLNQSNNIWQHQVTTKEPISQISIEVVLKLPSTASEVNKIIVEPASGDIKTQVAMEIAYSHDGLNWLFPQGESNKRLVKTTSYDFSFIKATYWRLRLTKQGNDGFFGNSYVYNFGLKSLLFLGKEYEKVTRNDVSYLFSEIIKPEKLDRFTALNLRVCESKPPRTQIKYELCPLSQTEVDGLEAGTIYEDDLKYYIANLDDKDSFSLDMLKLMSVPVANGLYIDSSLGYKDQRDGDYMLYNYMTGMSKTDTVLLRNAGDNFGFDVLGKAKKQRGSVLGWGESDVYYSTYVLVRDVDGEIIDLGDTEMIINGKTYSGKTKLEPGLNQITTLKSNWHSIDLSTLPPNSEVKVDPLYPYNHKYLIEGMNGMLYGRDLDFIIDDKLLGEVIDPKGVYGSKRDCWQIKMKELSFEQIESEQKSTLDVFSYKVDNTNQERIVVKSDAEIGLLSSESFSIITKIQNSDPIKGLIFKATLSTEDLKSTPVLTEYLLKFR